MNSESVDLIATDPPFNKGRDFHATPDSLAAGAKFYDRWSWERDVHEEWSDQIRDDYPFLMEAIESGRYAHSDGMGAFMCFMAVRLLEMRRVLKPNGTIYLHCDPTASHYLKAVMDALFGWRRFGNEIVWCYRGGGAAGRLRQEARPDLPIRERQSADLQCGRGSSSLFGGIVGAAAIQGARLPVEWHL
ncbi:MAG: DNA methyltransferase [Rhodospirillaceae bacterium]|nr:DNA methyltransferase [Rhodospirillaceae bacterium]